jgi:hypothetical protein
MTLQQTVNITKDRQIHLNLSVPQSVPIGKAEIKIIFASCPKTKLRKDATQSVSEKKSAFACLNEYADVSKIALEKDAWGKEVAKKHAVS